jgi:cytidine deaminase
LVAVVGSGLQELQNRQTNNPNMSAADLLNLARHAAENAYAPYSHFRVGCALETLSGSIFTGCNVENASYGLTMCAERNVIAQAVAEEGAAMKISRLAVVCQEHAFSPCGACRQVIAEFALPGGATEVTFLHGGDATISRTIAELLPHAFGL